MSETKNLIQDALRIATKGVQINDGHRYRVPAHDLVEYAETIKALVVALENEWVSGYDNGYDAGYADAVRDENQDNR